MSIKHIHEEHLSLHLTIRCKVLIEILQHTWADSAAITRLIVMLFLQVILAIFKTSKLSLHVIIILLCIVILGSCSTCYSILGRTGGPHTGKIRIFGFTEKLQQSNICICSYRRGDWDGLRETGKRLTQFQLLLLWQKLLDNVLFNVNK